MFESKEWKEEKRRIKNLKEALESLGEIPKNEKVFTFSCRFFNVTSFFQDNGELRYAPKKLLKQQMVLNKHIENSGRNESGVNRTHRGEVALADNVYWGDCFGIWTFTVRECLKLSPEIQQTLINGQVYPFLESHIPDMIKLCKELLA